MVGAPPARVDAKGRDLARQAPAADLVLAQAAKSADPNPNHDVLLDDHAG